MANVCIKNYIPIANPNGCKQCNKQHASMNVIQSDSESSSSTAINICAHTFTCATDGTGLLNLKCMVRTLSNFCAIGIEWLHNPMNKIFVLKMCCSSLKIVQWNLLADAIASNS